jgi:FtsH-binding integral membrane protein
MAYGQIDDVRARVRGDVGIESAFMASVYRWMALGLLVTAGVAWFVAGSPVARDAIFGNRMVFWALIIAQFGLVIALSAAVMRLSAGMAGLLFITYSALTGATLSSILLVYTGGSIASAFLVTAGTFGAMSVYGTVTKRDLSTWRTFLMMGLVGVVIASVVNIFLKSTMTQFVVSAAAVVVFTGLTAYDTQRLGRLAAASGDGALAAAMPVNGALMLYLDFINIFLSLLNLFGRRRS